jgi:hypothetical protein
MWAVFSPRREAMKKFLLPIVTLAMILAPAAANAAQCRNSDSGKFAKCGTPGSVPASQYVAKGKSKGKMAAKSMSPAMAPVATPTKSGMMSSMMHPKAKATMAPMAKPMKAARCKTAKGKFIKCGTTGAMPA